ncbi:LPS O-antigen chain length determinant protein, WzzB/FepE family [Pseudomonas cuatrocienegasensis]|uniref:LPS O-antigen chain length determinant protein, WzzB/FepE family n=1 Tax=Pseudomonas cuatrocienegasensis TaxID=543360 RepID=A0ABY1B9S4_9PSED|nr:MULTISPECIES: Wzz/FepE/Etk N-terminal domain-containing protein [Pseudomonas]SEQ32378.1 LPS O-antigen chain length determinant protein, WzzB/FepE family [Pseudomonas cuatrocienegasensis]
MNAITHTLQPLHDEIDLVEIVRGLWAAKFQIIGATLLCGGLALAYAFTVTPQYEVKSVLRPASLKDLDTLNSTGLYSLDPETALRRVGASLDSYDQRLAYFRENAELFEPLRAPGQSLEQNFERFNQNAFKILQPDLNKTDGLSGYVGLQLTYPADIDGVAILNGFVASAIKAEHDRVTSDLQSIIQNRLSKLDSQIAASRASYEAQKEAKIATLLEADALKKAQLNDELRALRQQLKARRDNRIAQLSEAIRIAGALNILKPTTPSALGEGARAASGSVIRTEVNNQQIPLYFMGTEALEAEREALQRRRSDDFTEPRIAQIAKELQLLAHNREVDVLKQRENEDLFLKKLAVWREEAARLQGLQLQVLDTKLVTIDQVAIEPFAPVKPRKALLLVIGLVLGGMLGVLFVLLRNLLKPQPRPV